MALIEVKSPFPGTEWLKDILNRLADGCDLKQMNVPQLCWSLKNPKAPHSQIADCGAPC